MTSNEAEFGFDFASDPYDDSDEGPAPTGGADAGGDPQALLSALWAMLARPAQGAGSTLAAHRQHTADRLVTALRHRPGQRPIGAALADLLTLGGSDPERFGESARGACVEAVERLMFTLASEPEGLGPNHAPEGAEPAALVVVALPSLSAGRRVKKILEALHLEVQLAPTVEALGALLLETPCELVLTEAGLPGADGPATAAAIGEVVRACPMHLRTQILCIDPTGAEPAPAGAGLRLAPRPVSRAELVLRVRTLLPLD